ncbi:MAG: DNA gyrase inhibitor YacG [Planctomycetota bacterium]
MSHKPDVHRTVCPVCKQPVEPADLAADENFPFCSRRCKLIDLGKWFDGDYGFSTPIEEEDE